MTIRVLYLAVSLAGLMCTAAGHAQTIWYVDDDSCPEPGSGTRPDPFCLIQDAIDASSDGDETVVAPGVYFENINYLGKGITIRSSNPADSEIVAATVIDGSHVSPGDPEGSVVVFNHQEAADSVLDGVTLTGGRGTVFGPNSLRWGGGVFCSMDSGPTIKNCIITDNTTLIYGGGGVSCRYRCHPIISNCTITGNRARAIGGGIELYFDCAPLIVGCMITNNSSPGDDLGRVGWGGGVFVHKAGPTIINSIISGNHANRGGGLDSQFSNIVITNCSIANNTANARGGGITAWSSGIPANLRIGNCILWDNAAPLSQGRSIRVAGPDNTLTVEYSDVEGGWGEVVVDEGATLDWGDGNIDLDPLFAHGIHRDYHLGPDSPCIDAGDNSLVPGGVTTDLDGDPRFMNDPATADCPQPDADCGRPPIVDMGAYEYQPGTTAYLDIKPGSCPNPVNVRSRGVVPVAIVGMDSFDASEVEVDSLVLARADGVGGAVAPSAKGSGAWATIEDVATPFDGEACDCHDAEGDGIDDLVLKFSTRAMVDTLNLAALPRDSSVMLTLSGSLLDGTPFQASDCIVIRGKQVGRSAKRESASRQ